MWWGIVSEIEEKKNKRLWVIVMVMVNRHRYLFFFFWLLPFGGERRYLPYTPVYPYMHIYIHT